MFDRYNVEGKLQQANSSSNDEAIYEDVTMIPMVVQQKTQSYT